MAKDGTNRGGRRVRAGSDIGTSVYDGRGLLIL